MSSVEVNNLPKGWEDKKWDEILEIKNGKSQKEFLVDEGGYPIYGSGGVMSGRVSKFLCPKNTTIIGRKGTIDKPYYIEEEFWNVDTAFGLCSKTGLNPRFLYYFCLIFNFQSLNKSTTLPSLTKRDLLQIRMPIPPLEEQKRIVAKIDTLFAKIDKAISLTEESLKQAQNLFTSSLSQKFDDLKQLYKSFPLMKYVDFIGGSQPPKSSFSYEFKEGFIRLIQIRDYKTDNHIVYIHQDSTKKLCEADDVMIGRYGPPVFQILRGIKGAYNVALMKAIPNESMVSKDFLFYFLQNSSIQNYIISISQRSAGQSGVNKKALEAYSIVLPPLDVQSKYVGIFNQLQSSSEETQSKLKEQLAYLKQLKSSILSKAFKGEL